MTGREQEPTAPSGMSDAPASGSAGPPRLEVQASGSRREAWVRWAVAALEEE